MAFAMTATDKLQQLDDKKAGVVTERDLLRQVASTMTKHQMLSQMQDKINQEAAASAKQFMTQNLNNCFSVWQAFEKFVYNQVVCKNRTVDTLIIGIFTKNQLDQVVYLPNPDYLEVGKFKLQRNLEYFKKVEETIDTPEVRDRYRQNYE